MEALLGPSTFVKPVSHMPRLSSRTMKPTTKTRIYFCLSPASCLSTFLTLHTSSMQTAAASSDLDPLELVEEVASLHRRTGHPLAVCLRILRSFNSQLDKALDFLTIVKAEPTGARKPSKSARGSDIPVLPRRTHGLKTESAFRSAVTCTAGECLSHLSVINVWRFPMQTIICRLGFLV
jgi:hypothetical protein